MSLIRNKFGSKRGLLNSVRFKFLFLIGQFKQYQQIDFTKVDNLVFICSGNICRSSFAEYAAKSLDLTCESYGLHCRGGDDADVRAILYAKKNNIEMARHKTRNINDYIPTETDLLIAMEPSHIEELSKKIIDKAQITLLPLWSIRNPYLHDPYNSTEQFFSNCESIVYKGVVNMKNKIIEATNKVSKYHAD